MVKPEWLHNLYRVWYRLYYYLFGLRIIKNPQLVELPRTKYFCRAEIDKNGAEHGSFLYVMLPTVTSKVYVWWFFRRHFIFSKDGGKTWRKVPALTPWSVKIWGMWRPSGKEVKYGLNRKFVLQHRSDLDKLQFFAYD